MKRVGIALALVLLLVAALVPLASADEVDHLNGSGWIAGHGDGVAKFEGTGSVWVAGNGVLRIWASDDDLVRVAGAGEKQVMDDGSVLYESATGQAYVQGTNVTVSVEGEGIRFYAQGHGTVWLIGDGRYRSEGVEGLWNDGSTVFAIGS